MARFNKETHKNTKQYKVYEEVITNKRNRREVASEFNISPKTVDRMIYDERVYRDFYNYGEEK